MEKKERSSRFYAMISYITWIVWLWAYLKRDREDTLVIRHLNQALVLNLISTVCSLLQRAGGIFAKVEFVVSLAVLVLVIMGIYRAAKEDETPLPLIGEINLVN